jgi:hypothetical protein
MTQQDILKPLIGSLAVLAAIGCGDAAPGAHESADRTTTDPEEQVPLTYTAWAYDYDGNEIVDTELTGIIRMREESEMIPLSGAYYDDGLGNLIWREAFESQTDGGVGEYALTFLHDGGVQLALDFHADRVVDAVFDITPEGRIGVIGHPALEAEIDCIARRIVEGEEPLAAVDACLGPGRTSGASGSGAGVAAPTGNEYDRLAEPDCGSGRSGGGVPHSVAYYAGEGWRQEGESETFERNGMKTTVSRMSQPNDEPGLSPDELVLIEMENSETGYSGTVVTTTDYGEDGTTIVSVSKTWTQRMPNGVIRRGWAHRQGGRLIDSGSADFDAETGECLKGDCPGPDSDSDADSSDSEGGDADGEGAEGTDQSAGANDGTGSGEQPGPDCEINGDCPFTDPRCEAPRNDSESLWDCVAATGASPMECLARIRDGVAAATGCVHVPGPSGQPELQCPRGMSQQLIDCLTGGGDLGECMESGLFDAGGEVGPEGPGGDDLLQPFRNAGFSDIDYVEISGVGAIFLGFCNEGVEQLCTGGRGAI